ncbi:hypothetical protein GE061_004016 [Apolygus lucorum]|uniref:Uncharacterized protein n=1 Tax=Apolygus lucorum TaxID=248454 RepID=A0A6A4J2F1_APOLU|nr:hypothetical protein GE061_004016 [Apolygus lucorum]
MNRKLPEGWPADAVCPHLHFKTNVIDRDILTKKQHLELLCTPRGYRWEVAFVKREEHHIVCSNKRSPEKPERPYVYKLLGELWSLVKPEMITKLQEIMEEEFGISKEEAREFICKRVKEMTEKGYVWKKDSTNYTGVDPNDGPPYPLFISKELEQTEHIRCRCNMSIKADPCVVKNVADVLAEKLGGLVEFSMKSKRHHRQKTLSKVIFNGLCRITGDSFNPKEPKSKLQKLQVFLADRMAMWLAQNIPDEDSARARKRRREDVVIRENSRKIAKDYDEKIRHRAALAKKIQNQKRVAEEREKQVRLKEESEKQEKEETKNKKKRRDAGKKSKNKPEGKKPGKLEKKTAEKKPGELGKKPGKLEKKPAEKKPGELEKKPGELEKKPAEKKAVAFKKKELPKK